MENGKPLLPIALWENNYDYPPALFSERPLKFDGCEENEIYIPVAPADKPLLMARYAVANSVGLPDHEATMIKLARNEVEAGFIAGIRKIWRGNFKSSDGLVKADVEIAAEVLGVYDLVFPSSAVPRVERKLARELQEEEKREANLRLSADAIADAYEQNGNHFLVEV